MRDLFVHELRDLYDAEHQLVKALPKLAQKTSSSELRQALDDHLEETQHQVERLNQIFKILGESPQGTRCDGMAGVLEESRQIMQMKGDACVIDAGLISAAQRIEHYEIAGYGCLRTYAERLGESETVDLIEESLEEEKQADKKLTEIAESTVNVQACQKSGAGGQGPGATFRQQSHRGRRGMEGVERKAA